MLEIGILCLALNIFHESRGEPVEGQKLVAQTTYYRSGMDKSKLCSTVTAKNQFSWMNRRPKNIHKLVVEAKSIDNDAWEDSVKLAKSYNPSNLVVSHFISKGALPKSKYVLVRKVGNHRFYRKVNKRS